MNLGDNERVQGIMRAWTRGDEVRGVAQYWNMAYAFLARLLASNTQVRSAALVVRFETLCDAPAATLRAVLEHCALPDAEPIIERYVPRVGYPNYYQCSFSPEEFRAIREETAATAALWGY